MARLFLSTSLSVALAFSSASGAFAATTATELITELQGTGVDASLVEAAQTSCATGSASQCILALRALLSALPANLPASLVAEVTEYVTATAGGRQDVVTSPDLVGLNAALAPLGGGQVTGSVTPQTNNPTPTNNGNSGGGSGGNPLDNDNVASAGAP